MNEKSFDAIFGDVISYLKGLKAASSPVEAENPIQIICTSIDAARSEIEDRYAAINRHTKDSFMKLVESEEIRLDRHKCAAAFMIAFLEKLKFDPNALPIPTIKERLAIRIGLSIMLTMIKDMNDKTTEEIRRESAFAIFLTKNNNNFKFPDVLSDTNPYEKNWELELYFANQDNRLFILSIANELFFIEKYNRMLAEEKQ
jgi:hypothetical protein